MSPMSRSTLQISGGVFNLVMEPHVMYSEPPLTVFPLFRLVTLVFALFVFSDRFDWPYLLGCKKKRKKGYS